MRYDDWPARLDHFLESRRASPFRYGVHDCCLFAADAVHSITGSDPAAEFRNTYHSRRGALRCLGGRSIRELAAEVFSRRGFTAIGAGCAQRGDVVLLSLGGGETLGVIALDSRPVAASASGWMSTTRDRVRAAWRVC